MVAKIADLQLHRQFVDGQHLHGKGIAVVQVEADVVVVAVGEPGRRLPPGQQAGGAAEQDQDIAEQGQQQGQQGQLRR